MNQEVVSAVGGDRHHSVGDLRQRADLLELLSEVDSRIHRVMERFIDAGERAKSEIGAMIRRGHRRSRGRRRGSGRELEASAIAGSGSPSSPQAPRETSSSRGYCAC